ncbi:unnamed protein product [Kuraishia capsulata CBS 1993]|uniref:Phosphotransferase n=1 Tax=Kuraishia capsulata CBS 1993 TaxID=1382522 RepID=W6MG15_9ASCO|nr:uncharacterized protein KUCA_T00000602001 [Kuraishia capsulata CBS 1993]CDK24636.1 unnamed protein product [Kuraishia capsulata CBS 1993]
MVAENTELAKFSLDNVSPALEKAYKEIEDLFTISPEVLKTITAHFITELQKGLDQEANIPMIPGWVLDFPTGQETGDYLAIDLGGTNLRVVLVTLKGNSDFSFTHSKYSLPATMRTADADDLWDFIADSLEKFIKEKYPGGCASDLPLGFTFSYPASQDAINMGVLQRWTKGFDIHNVEGHDVVPMLQKALKARSLPIEVVALINDTTGTLVASMYSDPETKMGLIFGTGCNGAYYDFVENVHKLSGDLPTDIPSGTPMAINCEYGAFDNERVVLPLTKYDFKIDEESPRPGQQAYEKMIAGYYLGEILRLILVDFYKAGLIFAGQDDSKLQQVFIMDTSVPSRIEEEEAGNTTVIESIFKDELNISTTAAERAIIRRLCILIGTRAARLSVCGVAAIAQKMGYKSGHCAADGSVFNKYPGFQRRAAVALSDIFGWSCKLEDNPIKLTAAEDGSGVGAAVIAALTEKRLKAGLSVGKKHIVSK